MSKTRLATLDDTGNVPASQLGNAGNAGVTKQGVIDTGVQASDLGGVAVTQLGAASGVATLGADGKLTPSQAPSSGGSASSVSSPNATINVTDNAGDYEVDVVYGTAVNTAAEGNDSRITGAAQKSANLSDLASASTARTNLGLGTSAVAAIDTTATDIAMNGTQAAGATGKVADAGHVHPSDTSRLAKASNLSDVASASTARTNLGLGTAAVAAVDTTASDFQPDAAAASAGSTGKVADAGHVHPASGLPKAGGLTGATAATRYVGATASGAPASGTFAVGDYAIDQTGKVWICTTAGTPGTWANAGASAGVSSFNTRTGAVVPGNADYLAVASGGLTGATAATRYVGGTTSGAPASGTFAVGDFVVAQNGVIWVCTTAGTPGTWTEVGGATPAPSGPGGTAGANTGSAVTIGNPSGFNEWWGVMNAATVTVTMPTATAGALFQARFDQDATGGRVLAFASNPTFPGYASATAAIAKVNAQSAASGHIWITFVCVDGTTWEAFPALPQGRSVIAVTSGASITPAITGPQDHIFVVSALAAAMTVNAPTGSPVDGQKIEFRLAQNATGGFAITWNAIFTTANTALITWPSEPTAASATWKELYEWNASTSKWERLAMV